MKRRNFFNISAMAVTAMIIPVKEIPIVGTDKGKLLKNPNPLKIGVMTYTLAQKWDIDTIISNLSQTGYQSVELRTTHAHGVEVTLTPAQRAEVKKRFKESPLETISLASGFEYHSPDPAVLKKNIEGTKEYIILARDVGGVGIRVFGNSLPDGVPEEKSMEQIARALTEVGEFGYNNGVEVRICIHGYRTDRVPVIKKILDLSPSQHVYVNWNCNPTDTEGQGLEYNFSLVKDRIRGVHMHELWDPEYPYRQFFKLLADNGYKGYCNAEIDENEDPIRLMRYYRALFLAYQDAI
jgi:sugar phosphate isomerase/epimerase